MLEEVSREILCPVFGEEVCDGGKLVGCSPCAVVLGDVPMTIAPLSVVEGLASWGGAGLVRGCLDVPLCPR